MVKSYCGHGIGDLFHCAPNVPHYSQNKVGCSGLLLLWEARIDTASLQMCISNALWSLVQARRNSFHNTGQCWGGQILKWTNDRTLRFLLQAVGVMKAGHVFSVEVWPHCLMPGRHRSCPSASRSAPDLISGRERCGERWDGILARQCLYRTFPTS